MKTVPCKDCGIPVLITDTVKLDAGIKIKIRCSIHKRGNKSEKKGGKK